MAIHTIEFSRGVPLNTYLDLAEDLEELFVLGQATGKTWGAGQKDNIFPHGCRRYIPGVLMPMRVHLDGTATIAVRKSSNGEIPDEQRPIVATVNISGIRVVDIRELVPNDQTDFYDFFSIPGETESLPFVVTVASLRQTLCFGQLFHRTGPSPKADRVHQTIEGFVRSIGY